MGRLQLMDIDTRDMSREDLRTTFGMVLQDTWLFNGTIKDNIAFGKEGATEEEIFAAAKRHMPITLSVHCRMAMTRF